jgi:hypothetical protein
VLIKKGRLELPHAHLIAIELLDALEHAHSRGVIHRDVKPDNLFLHRGPSGVTTTKLLDFGIVSLLDVVSRETQGRFLGTLRYAAPEQLRGERPTPRVDIYAAGLVLFEMIAGRGPFDDEGESRNVAAAHLNKLAPPISRFVPVPRELEALVASALAKSPADRPRDAQSFGAALRGARRFFGVPPEADAAVRSVTDSGLTDSTSPRAPFVRVQQEGTDGPIIVAPAIAEPRAERTPTTKAEGRKRAAAELPSTTLRGMSAPTDPGAPPPSSPTATSPEQVDRGASTHTALPAPAPLPMYGTEPYVVIETSETTTTPFAIASELYDEAGSEAPTGRDERHPGHLSPSASRRSGALTVRRVALGAGALFALVGLVSVLSFVSLSTGSPAAPPSARPAAIAPLPPPPPETPPAVEDHASIAASASEASSAPQPPPSGAAVAPPGSASGEPRRAKPPEKPGPAAVSHPVERPGPGF